MPDVLRVRWLGDAPAEIPLAGCTVEPDCVFDLPGRVVEDQDDCVIIETGNPPELRALPHSTYRVESPPDPPRARTAARTEE